MQLITATLIIDALGGTTTTAKLTGRKPQHVTNWRTSGRLPPDTFLVMKRALSEIGYEAPAALWGIKDPNAQEAAE